MTESDRRQESRRENDSICSMHSGVCQDMAHVQGDVKLLWGHMSHKVSMTLVVILVGIMTAIVGAQWAVSWRAHEKLEAQMEKKNTIIEEKIENKSNALEMRAFNQLTSVEIKLTNLARDVAVLDTQLKEMTRSLRQLEREDRPGK